MELKNKLKLVVGDWSKDGHNQSEDFHVMSNLDGDALRVAYARGTEIVGWDLSREYCRDYEDNKLPKDAWNRLKQLGFQWSDELGDDLDPTLDDDVDEDEIYLEPESFVDIYLFIVKLGDSNFQYKLIEDGDFVDIGGYGLFYDP